MFYSSPSISSTLESFSKASYRPSTVQDIITLGQSSNLQPKRNQELDHYLDEFYNKSSSPDPIITIYNIINDTCDAKAVTLFNKFYLVFIAWIIDLLSILKLTLHRDPFLRYSYLKNYLYNRFLHKPSAYMKQFLTSCYP